MFYQAQRDLTAVLHVHMIHVHVVHLHVLIHRLGIWNLPQIALQLIIAGQARQRPWRILVPARVIVARQVFTDLHDREQPPHVDVVVLALHADHRNTVARDLHAHLTHAGHAALAHGHVTRHNGSHSLVEVTW